MASEHIDRAMVRDAVKALGLDPYVVSEVTLLAQGVTIKRIATNEKGRPYYDEAFGGAAYEHYSVVMA